VRHSGRCQTPRLQSRTGGVMATKIKLGVGDAALLFRKDGTVEALFPRPYPKTFEEAQNVMTAQALFWAYNDDRMMQTIVEAVRAQLNRTNEVQFNRLN